MRNKNKSPSEVDNLSGIKKNKIDNLNNAREDDGVSAVQLPKILNYRVPRLMNPITRIALKNSLLLHFIKSIPSGVG